MVQTEPSQCSTSACGFDASPTAVHADEDVHDTPFSALDPSGLAFGLGTTDHEMPSHCSTRGFEGLPLSWKEPTATQVEAVTQDTWLSETDCPEPTLGLGTTDHTVPFHCSINA